MPLSFNLLNA